MSSGVFLLDDAHVFDGEAVYAKLQELDGQAIIDPTGEDTVPGLLMRIGGYLRTQAGKTPLTLLIEDNALDEEYFREFLDFYAATFWENPPTVRRLHFFASSRPEVIGLLSPNAQSPADSELRALGYLGYLVLRPTHPSSVGEILLQAPRSTTTEAYCVACRTRFGQTVAGRRLSVEAAPCIGQDQTGVCAHSALWGALKYLHKYRYHPKLSLPEIALRAGRLYPVPGAIRPAGGLQPEAVYVVLRDLGFQVYLQEMNGEAAGPTSHSDDPWQLTAPRVAHIAAESGLPALLGLSVLPRNIGHAVWVTGHTLGPQTNPQVRELNGHQLTEVRSPVTRFLVSDDNTGPYTHATVESLTLAAHPENEGQHQTSRLFNLRYDPPQGCPPGDPCYSPDTLRILTEVLVPLPSEVFLLPNSAIALVRAILAGGHASALAHRLSQMGEAGASQRIQAALANLETGKLRPRMYLCMSDMYREHIARSRLCPDIRERYVGRFCFPEYVWVTELVDPSLLRQESGVQDAVKGEVILDSTDSLALQPPGDMRYLCLHLPGFLVYPRALEATSARLPDLRSQSCGELSCVLLGDDDSTPYACFTLSAGPCDAPRSHRKLGPVRS